MNENYETLHLAPTLFYYLHGFLKTGFINPWVIKTCKIDFLCLKMPFKPIYITHMYFALKKTEILGDKEPKNLTIFHYPVI